MLVCLAVAGPAVAQGPRIPIPGPLDGPLALFSGQPVSAKPLKGAPPADNPALAANGRSGSGLAPGNGGASPYPGPLGNGTSRLTALQFGSCSALAFDADDRLLTLCNGPIGPALRLLDPVTLATLAQFALPTRPSADRTDIGGATHFIVRADGSLLIATNSSELISVAVEGESLNQTGAVDLAGALRSGERPFAVGAGFDQFDWVVGNRGTVLAVPRSGGDAPKGLTLGEPVAEDLATDPTGTYVVTRDALYRLRAGASGQPRVVWRQPVPVAMNDSHSGRIHQGPGTPPVIVAGGYVAIADSSNPARVTVARIRGSEDDRLACATPVFPGGKGTVEAHLVVAGRSVVVSNAYGYDSPLSTEGGSTTVGGMARVVVGPRGCRIAWSNPGIISPSAQPVVSRATGLLYTLEKPAGFPDAWNLAAIDWRTGAWRFSALAGEGLGHNSDGGAVVLGPDGVAYAGSFGGVTRFADGG